jgi:hypothetical protein
LVDDSFLKKSDSNIVLGGSNFIFLCFCLIGFIAATILIYTHAISHSEHKKLKQLDHTINSPNEALLNFNLFRVNHEDSLPNNENTFVNESNFSKLNSKNYSFKHDSSLSSLTGEIIENLNRDREEKNATNIS